MVRRIPRGERGAPLKLVASDGNLAVVGTLQEQVAVPANSLRIPKNIRDSPDMLELWNEIVPEMEEMGWLTEIDTASLALMIRHYAAALDASERLADEGPTIFGEREEKKHPADMVFRAQSTAFLAYAREQGMTLRSRMGGKPEAPASGGDDSNPFN